MGSAIVWVFSCTFPGQVLAQSRRLLTNLCLSFVSAGQCSGSLRFVAISLLFQAVPLKHLDYRVAVDGQRVGTGVGSFVDASTL